jgi:hypothetical protein
VTEPWDDDDPFDIETDDDDLDYRRPLWIPVAAAVVIVGMVAVAVPRFLWPWIVFFSFVGFLLWRAVSPRRP